MEIHWCWMVPCLVEQIKICFCLIAGLFSFPSMFSNWSKETCRFKRCACVSPAFSPLLSGDVVTSLDLLLSERVLEESHQEEEKKWACTRKAGPRASSFVGVEERQFLAWTPFGWRPWYAQLVCSATGKLHSCKPRSTLHPSWIYDIFTVPHGTKQLETTSASDPNNPFLGFIWRSSVRQGFASLSKIKFRGLWEASEG